jgi:hypothetical protein
VLSISATEAIVVGYFIDSLGYYQNYAELMNGGQFKNLNPPGQGGQYAGTNSEFTAISRVPGTADIDVSGYRDCPIDNLCPFVYHLNTTTGVWRLTTGKTPTTAGARFNAVDGISSGLTWAVGNSTVNSTTQAALIEKFNDATLGYTIEKLPLLPTNSGLADVAAESATNALAVGVSGPSNNQRPVALYWNGTAWSVASPATTLVSALFGVADIPGTNVYVDVGSKIVSGIGKTLIMKSTCD